MARPDTKTALLDHAQELVQTRGLNAFSYRDLALRLEIKPASIHYHFPTKSDLISALMLRYRADFIQTYADIDQGSKSAHKRIERFCEIYQETFTKGRMCLCGSLSGDIGSLEESVRVEVRGFFLDATKWLVRVLKEGVREGELEKPRSYQDVGRNIISALEGALLTSRTMDDPAWILATKRQLLQDLK